MNKKLLAAAISSALVAPMAAQAVEFSTSGHINRAVRFWDDGVASSVQNVDNSMSRSRFRFRGSQDMGNGMTAGIYVEAGLASNVTSKTAIKDGDGGDTAFDIRHSALYFSGSWGTVWMGHTFTASDNTLVKSFATSSIADTGTAPITMLGGAGAFRTTGGGTARTAATATITTSGANNRSTSFSTRRDATTGAVFGTASAAVSAFASYDGARTDSLRYDSPKIGPATISVGVGNNEQFDAGLNMDGGLGGGKYQLGAGYRSANGSVGQVEDSWNLSAAYLFSQGTNIAGYYSQADRRGGAAAGTGRTSESWWLQLGHNWGDSGVSISFGESQDHAAAGIDGSHWGVGFAHKIPKPGVTVYAGYRSMDLDGTVFNAAGAARSSEEMNIFWVGSLITFQ